MDHLTTNKKESSPNQIKLFRSRDGSHTETRVATYMTQQQQQ